MFQRLFALVFVLSFVASESASGGGLFGHRRARCPRPVTCCDPICCDVRAQECYCLQYKLLENGTQDLYQSNYFPDGCADDEDTVEHYSEPWYGQPDPDPPTLPQRCRDHNCENCKAKGGCKTATPMPGHGIDFANKLAVENKLKMFMTDEGIASSSFPTIEYYKIPKYKICGCAGATDDVWVACFKVSTGSVPCPAGAMYLGVQIPDLGVTPTYTLDNKNCERAQQCHTGGKLMRVNFCVPPCPDGQSRSLIVWLK